jgi:hypothetical protein
VAAFRIDEIVRLRQANVRRGVPFSGAWKSPARNTGKCGIYIAELFIGAEI